MNTIVKRIDPKPELQVQMKASNSEELLTNPLWSLPKGVRDEAYMLWLALFGQLDSTGEIAFRMSIWITRFGLLAEDAVKVMQEMQHPSVMKKYITKPHFWVEMAERVEEKIKERKERVESEERRRRNDMVNVDFDDVLKSKTFNKERHGSEK